MVYKLIHFQWIRYCCCWFFFSPFAPPLQKILFSRAVHTKTCLELRFKRQTQNKLTAVLFLEEPGFFRGLRFCSGQGPLALWAETDCLKPRAIWERASLPGLGTGLQSWGESFSGAWGDPVNATHPVSRDTRCPRVLLGWRGLCLPFFPRRTFTVLVDAGWAWRCMYPLRLEAWVFCCSDFEGNKAFLWGPKNIRGPMSTVPSGEVALQPRLVGCLGSRPWWLKKKKKRELPVFKPQTHIKSYYIMFLAHQGIGSFPCSRLDLWAEKCKESGYGLYTSSSSSHKDTGHRSQLLCAFSYWFSLDGLPCCLRW